MRWICCFGALLAAITARAVLAQVVPGDAAVQAQWFTGSLEAPSPALPKAGILAIEPCVIYTNNTGGYLCPYGVTLQILHAM